MDPHFPETSSGIVDTPITTIGNSSHSKSHAGMPADTFSNTSVVDQTLLPLSITSSHLPPPSHSDAPPRKRTRATPEQLSVLEKTFNMNPSPNNRVREQLARQLGMSERSIQIWFQNRRAKVKNMAKRSTLLQDEALRLQQYAAAAASAACQAAAYTQQQMSPDGTVATNPDLYNYYYFYYYNQQQQYMKQQGMITAPTLPQGHSMLPPPPPPPPVPPELLPASTSSTLASTAQAWPMTFVSSTGARMRAHTVSTYPSYYPYQRVNAAHTIHDTKLPHESPNSSNTGATTVDHEGTRHNHRSYASASPTPQQSWHQMTPIPSNSIDATERDDSIFCSDFTHTSIIWQQGIGISPSSVAYPSLQAPLSLGEGEGMNISKQHDTGDSNYRLISAEALQIGTWKRINLRAGDLVCGYDSLRCMFMWCIRDGHQRFKMEFSLTTVQKIHLHPLTHRLGWARLELCLTEANISFYMESAQTGTWTQCRDFTQDKQAGAVLLHHLDGPALALRAELTRMATENARIQSLFQNDAIQPSVPPAANIHLTTAVQGHPHNPQVFASAQRVTPIPTDAVQPGQPEDDIPGDEDSSRTEKKKEHNNEPSMLALMEKEPTQDLLLFQGIDP